MQWDEKPWENGARLPVRGVRDVWHPRSRPRHQTEGIRLGRGSWQGRDIGRVTYKSIL